MVQRNVPQVRLFPVGGGIGNEIEVLSQCKRLGADVPKHDLEFVIAAPYRNNDMPKYLLHRFRLPQLAGHPVIHETSEDNGLLLKILRLKSIDGRAMNAF